ncbi:GLPGLI family protein [Flavobacterium fryxellicola]|nr:GLPGLI family protein [Flavobacterium fryxellicola]
MCIAIAAMTNSFGQTASGVVIYKIQIVNNNVNVKNSSDNDLIEATLEFANKQTATLNFNSIRSSFILNQFLISESDNTELRRWARSMAFIQTVLNDYFFDKSANTSIERKEKGQLVNKTNKILDWEITTESKIIDGYLCYKAMYYDKFINRKGVNTSVPIVAWFAPSLLYGYGPKYFNGLPGLILELNDRETTFYATSISILNNKELVIDFPTGKTTSQEDYFKKVLSY